MDYAIHLPTQLREHLRALRKERGLTQVALGRLLGVGQARVAEIENNPGAVSVDQLMRVLSALQASLILRDDADYAAPSTLGGINKEKVASSKNAYHPTAPVAAHMVREADPNADAAPTPKHDAVIRPKKGSW